MDEVVEEAQADGLNLLELRDVGKWLSASCDAAMAEAMESLAFPPAHEHDALDELVDAVDDEADYADDNADEETGAVDERE